MNVCVLLDLRDPVSDGLERSAVGYVVNKKDSLCAAEVGGRDRAESLLPRRVPNLKLNSLAVNFDVLDLEIDTNGGYECWREGVVRITQQKTSLTHAGVSDHEQLDLHVIGSGLTHPDRVATITFQGVG